MSTSLLNTSEISKSNIKCIGNIHRNNIILNEKKFCEIECENLLDKNPPRLLNQTNSYILKYFVVSLVITILIGNILSKI